MKDKCFDLGTIQAFTDGELGSGLSERLLKHVAACDECAALLSECEDESAFAYSVLDDELNVLVPTERLRAKVFASIDEIEGRRRSGWLSQLAAVFSLNSPGLAVAASVVIVLGVIVLGIGLYETDPGSGQMAAIDEAADSAKDVAPERVQAAAEIPAAPMMASADAQDLNDDSSAQKPFRAHPAVLTVPAPGAPGETANNVEPVPAYETNIVSEDSYLQTIATLDQTVTNGKELLRPSERVAFERDLAVVNDAIVKMKDEVRRNPDNQAAREVLKSSYQNKVDLLNSVAEKTELMASLQ